MPDSSLFGDVRNWPPSTVTQPLGTSCRRGSDRAGLHRAFSDWPLPDTHSTMSRSQAHSTLVRPGTGCAECQPSRHESIACTVDCLEENRANWVFLKFSSQTRNVSVDRPQARSFAFPPYCANEFLARKYTIRVVHEELQQPELMRRGRNRLAGAVNLHPVEVNNGIA
jgi:hypothetical protein